MFSMKWELNFCILFRSSSSITWPCHDPDGPSLSCHRSACVWPQIRPSEVYGGHSGTRTVYGGHSGTRTVYGRHSGTRTVYGGHSGTRTVFLRILLLFPLSITPPMLHTNLLLSITLIRRTSGRNLGTIQATLLRISECTGRELTFRLLLLRQLFLFK
jgi:hypothetical protein